MAAPYPSRKILAVATFLFLSVVVSSVGILYHRQTSRLSAQKFTISRPEPLRPDGDDIEKPTSSFTFHPTDALVDPSPEQVGSENWTFNPEKHAEDYGLDETQCDTAFPDMYFEIERAAAYWKQTRNITIEDVEVSWKASGLVRAMIYDRHVSTCLPKEDIYLR